MKLCGDYGSLDFQSSCVRAAWASILPATFVFALCILSIPIPAPVKKLLTVLGAPFQTYLTLHEAEALDVNARKDTDNEDPETSVEVSSFVPLWRTLIFVFLGVLQTICWIADGSFQLYIQSVDRVQGFLCFLVALCWLYTAIRPVARPVATPPYDLFALYLILFATTILQIGGVLFDHSVLGYPLPSTLHTVALMSNLVILVLLISLILSMPLSVPSSLVDKSQIVRVFPTLL